MTLCPSHHLPLDRRRAAATGDAFMCAACESLYLARLANRPCPIPEMPKNATSDEAMMLLVKVFSDPRL
jgi:hypothetical protein